LLLRRAARAAHTTDDTFQELIEEFGHDNCDVFEDSEENKLEYTEIFNKYVRGCFFPAAA
jgi:The ARF-like 2 binding protein BART